MLQFIHTDFKVDLTHLEVVFSEINQLFSDEFSTEFSFPFEFHAADTFAKNLAFNPHYNGVNETISFPGILDRDGVLIDAILTINNVVGEFVSATISAGFSDFPNFSKKLPDLPLENFTVSDIAAHALTIIPQNYPDVNYDFRMVHTDKYDPESTQFFSFGKIFNNYASGAFLQSHIDAENVDQIVNIIQPFPYLMYVLKKAMEDAGYTLAGDILTDPDLNQALLFKDAEYYTKLTADSIPLSILNTEYDSIPYTLSGYIQHAHYYKEITIERKGNYKILGEVIRYFYWSPDGEPETGQYFSWLSDSLFKITKVSGTTTTVLTNHQIDHLIEGPINEYFPHVSWSSLSIDINVSLNPGDKIIVEKLEARRDHLTNVPYNPEVVSLDLFPLRYLNPDGSPILITSNFNKIDLKLCVPNITVGELVKFIKNSKNYKFIPDGNVVYMNKIRPSVDRQTAIDLTSTEIDKPKQTYNNKKSFEMSFRDMNVNEAYKYDTAFYDKDGIKVNVYDKKNDTIPITVDGLPLPVIDRYGIRTAYALDDAPDKIRLIFRNPMGDGLPTCFWNENFTIPNLMSNNFIEWLNFRINSVKFEWESIVSVEKMREISINSLVYAYSNYHLLNELEKERIDILWWRVSFKTEVLT